MQLKRCLLLALVKKAEYNAKFTKMESKLPSSVGLATNTALTTVENKIPDVSSLVTKTDYNTKVDEIVKKVTDHDHDKYITTSEFNKLTAENFAERLAHANLVEKTNIDTKLISLYKKIGSNKTKHLLVENELKKLKTSYSSHFGGKGHFVDNDGTQSYLVFQPIGRYFKRIIGFGSGEYIYFWKSKGLSDERINYITESDYRIK